jgi:hypothetical protein
VLARYENPPGLATARIYCRKCRSRLKAPVENEHHAFCTKFCFETFYRNRCRVCENDLRKTEGRGYASRLYCRPPYRCKAEAARWPEKYEYGLPPTTSPTNVRNAHSICIELPLAGDRPSHRCLREWSWSPQADFERALRDRNGNILARLEHNGGRYRLTHPGTFPILSWPRLEQARPRAEAFALSNLPAGRARNGAAP